MGVGGKSRIVRTVLTRIVRPYCLLDAFGCLRKLVIAGCFACSFGSAVCPSLAIWRLRFASPDMSTKQSVIANITVEYNFDGTDRKDKIILHRPLFLKFTFVLSFPRIFGLLCNTRISFRLRTGIRHCVCEVRGVHITGLRSAREHVQ